MIYANPHLLIKLENGQIIIRLNIYILRESALPVAAGGCRWLPAALLLFLNIPIRAFALRADSRLFVFEDPWEPFVTAPLALVPVDSDFDSRHSRIFLSKYIIISYILLQ